ncbi:MAG: glycosyltransferase [Methanoregulaceae archaeon]|jgi:glycosyltransferase involved in cell wall biosynthesis
MILNKTICLATSQFEGIDHVGGIGTYYRELSILLSSNGWNVIIVYLSGNESSVSEEDISTFSDYFLNIHGIQIYDARVLCKSMGIDTEIIHAIDAIAESDRYLAQSHIMHEAIQVLKKKYGLKIDLIEFHEWQGIGAIPIRMKKIFGDYKNTKMIVKLHSPDAWIRESYFKPSLCPKDIKIDYLNRYSFNNADIQVSPTEYLLEWCKFHGWNVRADASVCRNIISFPEVRIPEKLIKENLIAFFGRIEERKGLLEFIDSLLYIKRHFPEFTEKYGIAFIGKEGKISPESIRKQLSGYEIEFYTFVDRDDALSFIKDKARLVVIPSWQDNFPNTILECMSLAVPFITSRGGGIPEILGKGSELYHSISCDVTDPKQFGDLIINYLNSEQETTLKILSVAHNRLKELVDSHEILEWYGKNTEKDIPSEDSSIDTSQKDPDPRVTATIVVRDQTTEKYLETTINSVLMQTFKNIKIIIHSSSSDPQALLHFEYFKNKYREKGITFLHAQSLNGVYSINQILPIIDTKYLVIMNGGDIARPEMVELLVMCMENHDTTASMTCYYRNFNDSDESEIVDHIKNPEECFPKISHNSVFSSIGPCIPLIFFENIMGTSNSIYATSIVKEVGGWPDIKFGNSDWTMRLKLLAFGCHLDIVPKILLCCRENSVSERFKPKLIFTDEININYIKILIKEYPEHFSHYYERIHKLLRCSNLQAHPGPAEPGTLLIVSNKLGELASRNRIAKIMLLYSGNIMKKFLKK